MEENIIAIRKRDSEAALNRFDALMSKTEQLLNEAANTRTDFKIMSPSIFEECALAYIKKACDGTPFDKEQVFLISGHKFPDIVANGYYGVEVKSTNKDHWTSTGSSIVESTRIKDVDDIYMLFGKLGGKPAQFKCRPYQDVLYDIAVTHSPRYLIDMELGPNETIFDKMGMDYNSFRTSTDSIEEVKKYYKKKAKSEGRSEMPWWITQDSIELTQPFSIRLWNTLDKPMKEEIATKCMILFPEVLNPDPKGNKTRFAQSVLWICSYYQVVTPNVRDLFTAGGQITRVDGQKLEYPIPKIFYTIIKRADIAKKILKSEDKEMDMLLKEHNKDLYEAKDRYEKWLDSCDALAKENHAPHFREWVERKPKFAFSKKN